MTARKLGEEENQSATYWISSYRHDIASKAYEIANLGKNPETRNEVADQIMLLADALLREYPRGVFRNPAGPPSYG